MSAGETIHGGCVVVGEAGLLIRGASGTGKSTLSREIVLQAGREGRFARLVSDDRTHVAARHGRLVASPVEPLGGLLEIHGVGIVRQPFEPAAIVRLVLDLCEDPPRHPQESEGHVTLCGVMIPRIRMRAGASSPNVALSTLSGVHDALVTL